MEIGPIENVAVLKFTYMKHARGTVLAVHCLYFIFCT